MASLRDTVAGVCGSVCCVYSGLPFDVAKCRLQNQGEPKAYRGLGDCMLKTARQDGPLALYRGAIPALSSSVAENMVGVPVQRALRRQYAELTGHGGDELRPMVEISIGMCTGIFTSVTICPFEVLKVSQQVHGTDGGLLTVLKDVLRTDGFVGLYRGLASLMLRDVPFNGFFYGSYETFCALLMQWHGVESKEKLTFTDIFFAGGVALPLA